MSDTPTLSAARARWVADVIASVCAATPDQPLSELETQVLTYLAGTCHPDGSIERHFGQIATATGATFAEVGEAVRWLKWRRLLRERSLGQHYARYSLRGWRAK